MAAAGRRASRKESTNERRQAILEAALACFSEQGFQGTTMEDVRERSGASTGSVYHHFRSKEGLAAELYLEGVRQVQEGGLRELVRHRDAERGVRALVRWYLRWVVASPRLASYLMNHRHADFLVDDRRLESLNARLRAEASGWLGRHVGEGMLPALPWELYWAVLIGPSELVCRRRLREGDTAAIAASERTLCDAAWGAMLAIRARQVSTHRSRRAASSS